MTNYVFCAVDRNNIIQTISGKIKKGRYFLREEELTETVRVHNVLYPNNKWHIVKYELVEVSITFEND